MGCFCVKDLNEAEIIIKDNEDNFNVKNNIRASFLEQSRTLRANSTKPHHRPKLQSNITYDSQPQTNCETGKHTSPTYQQSQNESNDMEHLGTQNDVSSQNKKFIINLDKYNEFFSFENNFQLTKYNSHCRKKKQRKSTFISENETRYKTNNIALLDIFDHQKKLISSLQS